jgi:hypothetical protein
MSSRWDRRISAVSRAGAVVGLCLALGCDASPCANRVLRDIPSPDERRHAVLFERDCGATTDFSTQVSILTRGRAESGGGNVFVADTDHGKAPSGPSGGPIVSVRWLDARTVEIRYDPRARVFKQIARHDDTEVRYAPDQPSVSRP